MGLAATRRRWISAAVGFFLLLGAHQAIAQAAAPQPLPAIELSITGRVVKPRTLTLTDLQALPPVTVEITHAGPQGPQTGVFTGALVWTLLEAAVLADENGPRTRLQHGLIARGRDGYGVLLAIGELSPEFEGKQVVVAYAEGGKPLPALRLIVPADKRAGRAVRDLVAIEVR